MVNRNNPQKRSFAVCICSNVLLCFSFGLLTCILLMCVLLVGLGLPLGIERPNIATLSLLVFQSMILPVISYLAEVIKTLFPWPAVVLLLIAVVLMRPERLSPVISWIGEFEGFGVKYKGRAANAPTEVLRREMGQVERMVDAANNEIAEAYRVVDEYVAKLRDRYELPKLLGQVSSQVATIIGSNCPPDFRLTLYIPDIIFSERLYQVAEYYDKFGNRSTIDRAGRALSIRYGVGGRVWRSKVNEIEGELLAKEDQDQMKREGLDRNNPDDVGRYIARRWGFTLGEVAHIRRYNSYGAILLQRASAPVGLIYFDSKETNAFGSSIEAKQTLDRIVSMLTSVELSDRLLEISNELQPWAGGIEIFRGSR